MVTSKQRWEWGQWGEWGEWWHPISTKWQHEQSQHEPGESATEEIARDQRNLFLSIWCPWPIGARGQHGQRRPRISIVAPHSHAGDAANGIVKQRVAGTNRGGKDTAAERSVYEWKEHVAANGHCGKKFIERHQFFGLRPGSQQEKTIAVDS